MKLVRKMVTALILLILLMVYYVWSINVAFKFLIIVNFIRLMHYALLY